MLKVGSRGVQEESSKRFIGTLFNITLATLLAEGMGGDEELLNRTSRCCENKPAILCKEVESVSPLGDRNDPLRSPYDDSYGVNFTEESSLEHVAREGDLLYPGSVIARLVDQKDSEKYKPRPFLEAFSEWAESPDNEHIIPETKKHSICFDMCMNVLRGSIPPGADFNMNDLVEELFCYLESSTLPYALFKQALSPMVNRLPEKFCMRIKEIVEVDSMENFVLIKIAERLLLVDTRRIFRLTESRRMGNGESCVQYRISDLRKVWERTAFKYWFRA
ncbi:unnamed protein product [Haemonchus placei]|uniref:ACC_central domain-containing protein n=1 Tax=Haemonchus placei TaxID=6290 RepID=A0A0N4WLX4_HAEPC|nr:unnamed protein product [Haemonchus placei]